MTTPARVDSQNPDTEGRGVRCYASERRAKASQSLVGWGIDIEIAIGIEQRRNAEWHSDTRDWTSTGWRSSAT